MERLVRQGHQNFWQTGQVADDHFSWAIVGQIIARVDNKVCLISAAGGPDRGPACNNEDP
jgi:hypothetical protein